MHYSFHRACEHDGYVKNIGSKCMHAIRLIFSCTSSRERMKIRINENVYILQILHTILHYTKLNYFNDSLGALI